MPHLAEERSRLNKLEWKNFDASMIGSTVGAEIDGIDLAVGISSDALEELHEALVEYKVIFCGISKSHLLNRLLLLKVLESWKYTLSFLQILSIQNL